MAKIPFPDIPAFPGVSDIPINTGNIIPSAADLSVTNIIGAVRSGSFLSAYQTLFGLKYGIYKEGKPIIEVDTILEINISNQSQISDYPIETGSFATYNKVALPSTYRLEMLKTNSLIGASKSDVIGTLQSLLRPAKPDYSTTEQSTDDDDETSVITDIKDFFGWNNGSSNKVQFVDVVTPDKTYTNVQLESYDVTETYEQGVSLNIQATLKEVREQISELSNNPTTADGAEKETLGQMISRNFDEAKECMKDAATTALDTIKGIF